MRYLFLTALAGLLVACTPNSGTQANTQTQSEDIAETIDTSQTIINVTRSGNSDGRTIIFIHGLASDAAVWSDVTAPLLKDYDIRTVQVAGFAGAQAINIETGITDKVTDAIMAHLSNMPGKDTVLVGHSMGGFLSMKAGLKRPDLINEIVIVDSLPYLAGMMMPNLSPEQAKQQSAAFAQQMKSMPRDAFDYQQKLGLSRLTKNQSFLPELESWSQASDQNMVANMMAELLGTDLRDDLSNLSQPVSVFMPYDKAMGIPKETVLNLYRDQYAKAQKLDIKVIEDSFHFIMKDNPSAFQEALNAAIRD